MSFIQHLLTQLEVRDNTDKPIKFWESDGYYQFIDLQEHHQFWIVRTAIKTLDCYAEQRQALLQAMGEDNWLEAVERVFEENKIYD